MSLFLLLLITAGAIQFPYVQTKIINYISIEFSKVIGYSIKLDQVSIWWFDTVEAENVVISDPDGNDMIKVASLELDFDLYALLDNKDHHIDAISISGAEVAFTKLNSASDSLRLLNINDFIKKVKALRNSNKKKRLYFSCDELTLENASFVYNDQMKDSINNRFDYFHFNIDSINGTFENVWTVKDTFSMEVKALRGYNTNSGLKINNISTDFTVSQKAMLFDKLELSIGESTVRDSIRFDYSSTADLSGFNNRVLINAQLSNSVISSKDLAIFAPEIEPLNQTYNVTGRFNGLVRSFLFSQASISFGNGSTVRGRIRMTGLPNFQETFIDFNLANSFIKTEDVRSYVQEKTFSRIAPFDYVSFTAEFLGFPNDFVSTGNFFTEHGRIDSDINLKLADDISKTRYSGKLRMIDFDLGGYFSRKDLGLVNLQGNIEGSGFTIETADFKLDGKISNIGIRDYNYKNITSNARFAKEFFEGELMIDDPGLGLEIKGSIDLRENLNYFNVIAKLDTTNLRSLNLTEEDFIVKSEANVNASGLQVDEILGAANFGTTYLSYRNNSIEIDTLSLISDKDETERLIFLNSNLFDAQVKGEFDITQLYQNVGVLIKEYQLSLRNNLSELNAYYEEKNKDSEDYSMEYTVNVKDLNPLLEVFAPNVYVSNSTQLKGEFTGGYTSIISLESSIDSLSIDDNIFVDSELQLNVSKVSDSTNVLASAFIYSKDQLISGISTKEFFFEGIWNNDHIDYEFDIEQTAYANEAAIIGSVDFEPDTIVFKFLSADLKILEDSWQIEKNNSIALAGKNFRIKDFIISNNKQRISVAGDINDIPNSKLTIDIDSVELDNLNTILNKNISGVVNGYAQFRDVYQNMLVENNLNVDRLYVDSLLIGNIKAATDWDNVNKKSTVLADLERDGLKVLDISGNYSPKNSSPLDLKAELNGTELRIIEPFLSSYFSNIQGKLFGEVSITGTPYKPDFKGFGKIDSAAMHINYLNTDYRFNGNFYLSPDKIGFENISIKDVYNQNASLNGFIKHDYFRNMTIDIGADFENFLVLDTDAKDNDLFYGNGVATGDLRFEGPISNMNITASASTQKGTRIYIPIGDSETIEKEEFISYIDFDNQDLEVITKRVESVDLRGIKLDFDLNITSDAYCEIIFDIKSGDIIRGRGNGDIKLEIDTKGDFNMFGAFNIEQGGYNFTLYNLINKEFEVLPNSRITWYGDPYQGVLDIDATYSQLASFIPLLPPEEEETEIGYNDVVELRRKYPVDVVLDIQGPLLSPNVEFDITTGSLPRNVQMPNGDPPVDLEFEFLRFKTSVDEQELKRQVFSLIILRKFSPLLSFNTGGGGLISNSVSELLSNQLSYWITQVDENLEIDVDFGNLDEEAFNTFQLRLSYTFLDGRLRVTRDGGFTNQANQADVSSIAGDWTVEYFLTNDGRFKVKMYNRTNFNPINPTEESQNTITTGFSLLHTQNFDELRDLFINAREKAQKKKKRKQNEEDLYIESNAIKPENETDEDS